MENKRKSPLLTPFMSGRNVRLCGSDLCLKYFIIAFSPQLPNKCAECVFQRLIGQDCGQESTKFCEKQTYHTLTHTYIYIWDIGCWQRVPRLHVERYMVGNKLPLLLTYVMIQLLHHRPLIHPLSSSATVINFLILQNISSRTEFSCLCPRRGKFLHM